MTLLYTHMESPVGPLLLAGDGQALHVMSFSTGARPRKPEPEWRRDDAPFKEAKRQLDAYFAGDLRCFDLPYHLSGSDFQVRVWRYLAEIPFGETRSYGAVASALGDAGASRAVGAANGKNRLAIILPCHRVIGANGALVGFGGGLETKTYLLRHEGALPATEDRQFDLFDI
ncbi:methylated-DNA--[protein]-cysteine S-methyltransferase [Martelella radicis]|uniref:Methylated-DNA--protein-cysteine methyltransferase n=1 Tax=Martelella radicis TaxID=1397476 RepID=A0A7W6PA65_9HYPH|nr:methylated-DNA--[protein]-cysteine S-methyltransferase [Martelella radicis]MBB4122515.1 methylated-DNA-[protein]-cysteine S-methyltransferase [Martelella radicis]